MTGKIAWITGGSSGLGLSIAQQLASEGWKVAISGRDPKGLEQAAATIGSECATYVGDVGDAGAMSEIVAAIEAGQGPIAALVANAGKNVGVRAWGDVAPADFSDVFNVNVSGAFNSINAVLPNMRARGYGRIIAISSFAGWYVTPQPGPAYTASKMAVLGLVASLNMAEVRNGICATALCPGEVATPAMARRVPPPSPEVLARMLQPEDVASAVSFILGLPVRAAINELVISPSANNAYNRIPGPPFETK